MRINHNIAALNTFRQLSINETNSQKNLEKLSSGQRINKAADDAAGLAISEKMRAQIRGLDQASRNAQDGISMIQTAEGGLSEVHEMLKDMRDKLVQAANDTNATQDRSALQDYVNSITSEINRIGNTTEFNTLKLLNGGSGVAVSNRAITVNVDTAYAANSTTTPDTLDMAGGAATGSVSNVFTATSSVKKGTLETDNFKVIQNSVKKADAGDVGSPIETVRASVGAGTAKISGITELGASVQTPTAAGSTVAKVNATPQTWNTKFTTDFGAADTIKIDVGGVNETFTAGGADATTGFAVGANTGETLGHLVDAINADTKVNGLVTASVSGGDTLVLTSKINADGTNNVIKANTIVKDAGGSVVVDAASNKEGTAYAAGTSGVDKYQFTSQFRDGQTITFDGVAGATFTAKTSGADVSNGEFNIGSDLSGTIDNLIAAIHANAAFDTEYTVAKDVGHNDTLVISGSGVYTANGVTQANADTAALDGTKTGFAFEVQQNFTDGDTITIGDETYTARTAAAKGSHTEFTIGATLEETVGNIKGMIEGSLDTNDNAYTISLTDPTWSKNDDTNLLVFTQKTATNIDPNYDDMMDTAVTQTAGTKGEYRFEIKDNFQVGQKVSIGGFNFTAVAAGDGVSNTATQFIIGADNEETAKNLLLAIGEEKKAGGLANYDVSRGDGIYADTITFVERNATGHDLNNASVSSIAAQGGKYSIDITKNFAAGDSINLNGKVYTADTDFAIVDGDIAKTVKNLVDKIEADKTAGTGKFAAVQQHSEFATGNRIVLTEELVSKDASGVTLSADEIKGSPISEVKGKYEFKINNNFADGDVIKIDNQMLLVGNSYGLTGDFAKGDTATDTAKKLADAINGATTSSSSALQALKAKYSAESSGDKVTLTEKDASGTDLLVDAITTGKNSDNQGTSSTPTAAVVSFKAVALDTNSKVTIDGRNFILTENGTAKMVAGDLKTMIEADATLKDKYAVTVNNDKVTLTQKTAKDEVATVSYSTTEYNGFVSRLQIGANTDQSMTVDIGDMRARALKISGVETGGEVVASNGSKASLTAVKAATDGTNDVAAEYTLDVSSNDKATAAISVLDDAIKTVSEQRSKLGAFQNRLEHTINNLATTGENLTAAESRVRDVDMAKEMMEYTKNNILNQAAQAMLAQANQAPQGILQLLK